MAGKVTRPMEERFWEKVCKTRGCWLWTACTDGKGYGSFTPRTNHKMTAHRMSWVLTHGSIGKGYSVLHRCDNPLCVRPNHLFLGTQADNIADMVEKKRQAIGESCNSRLTATQVRKIRNSNEPAEVIGKRFGIHKRHVFRIRSGERWGHL
jgi:hypothetical protein